MKLNIKTVGAFIFVILILLMFFSKTIYTFNISSVTGVLPKTGKLSKLETTKGTVDWSKTEKMYSDISGKVLNVLVDEGDNVFEAQGIVDLSFDVDTENSNLNKLKIDRNKLDVDIENINMQIAKFEKSINDLLEEEYEKDNVSLNELVKQEDKIKLAEENYNIQSDLFEAGAIPKSDLDNLENEINVLKLDYDNMLKNIQESEKKIDKEFEDKEKSREKQIQDYRYEIEVLNQSLKTKQMDIKNNEDEQAEINKTLLEYNSNESIYSPINGTVVSIDVSKGEYINKGVPIATIGVTGEYIIETEISIDNNFVVVDDEVKLSNASHTGTIIGTVTKIIPSETGKKVTIKVNSDEVAVGETFDIKFEKESKTESVLIPNAAVNLDSDGHFVYLLKKRDGILGKEFYVERLSIYIGDSDNDNTVVISGITFFEPIVQFSDKVFYDGSTVKIKNEGDFFVN